MSSKEGNPIIEGLAFALPRFSRRYNKLKNYGTLFSFLAYQWCCQYYLVYMIFLVSSLNLLGLNLSSFALSIGLYENKQFQIDNKN